ncbi:hypothetical protein [Deinococcus ficus]|uniref:hypothetical protein n=1 Tax=Deinococcus ficus TaxID=317577 RepID=UPI00131B2304|nr:hypothetical protein [Deinococcus ficus]
MTKLFKLFIAYFGSQERRISRMESEAADFMDGITYDVETIFEQLALLKEMIEGQQALSDRMLVKLEAIKLSEK